MSTAPNQKIIRIQKTKGTNEILYTPIVIEAIDTALKTLSPSEFKVWMYLVKNKDNFILAFSSTDCSNACGISKSTCKNAINRLIELGYLTKKKEETNLWLFHDLPVDLDEQEPMQITFNF